MKEEKLFVNSEYLLKKYSGKGGWTYAEILEISQNKKALFGWVRVDRAVKFTRPRKRTWLLQNHKNTEYV